MHLHALAMILLFAAGTLLSTSSSAAEARHLTVEPTDQPITIDGRLDDPGWRQATEIDLPYEWLPGDNVPPPVRTIAYVTYDRHHVYVAWRCEDPDPSQIRAHLMDRDDVDSLVQDDHVVVLIDTFNDERRAIQLRVNPLGVQADAIFSEGEGVEDFSFDLIWKSAGKIHEYGYAVEVAIPVNQLRFPRGTETMTWGFDLGRSYPRNVRHRISGEVRDRNRNCVLCQATKVTGFRGLEPGRNAQITPTLTATRTDRLDEIPNGDLASGSEDADAGLDARWSITPNLTLNLALNPDFSQVEADVAQLAVNERFALFFEEKRPFFLEGVDIFSTPIQAVFTRTVVDPSWGLKLTGKEGKSTFGVFAARDQVNSLVFPGSQGSRSTLLDEEVSSGVVRYRHDVGSGSTVGVLWAGRDGSDYSNHVYGADAFLRLDRRNTLRLQALGSETRYPSDVAADFSQPGGSFSDVALTIRYDYQSRNWGSWFWFDDRGRDFRADSGFLPQVDIRTASTGFQRQHWGEDDDWWDQLWYGLSYTRTEDQNGLLDAESSEVFVGLQGPLQSSVHGFFEHRTQQFAGVVYDGLDHAGVSARFQPNGSLAPRLFLSTGDEIDFVNNQRGDSTTISPGLDWRIGRHLNLRFDHTLRRLDVPGGRLFEANLSQLRVIYNFDVRSFARLILQRQTIDRHPDLFPFVVEADEETLFTQLLYSYKLNPQTVLFAGYSDNRLGTTAFDLLQTDRTFFLKLGYAWTP